MLPTVPEAIGMADLEQQVQLIQKKVLDKDPAILSHLKPYHIAPEHGPNGELRLSMAQARRVLARQFGFSSWLALEDFIGGDTPRDEPAIDQWACRFLNLVVLLYSETESHDPERFEQAAELLRQHPQIADHSIQVAAAIGDIPRLEKWLNQDSGLLNRRGGHHDWEPLLYAAYSRLPGVSTWPAGSWLLAQGADPNAHYMWGGQYKFTALTGVFGQGEGGPVNLPEHPDVEPFARALLEAGANPNDSQAAYNRMFTENNLCLELLLEFGINHDDKNNWLLCENDSLVPHPTETLHYQLMHAVRSNNHTRVELLIDHGIDINHANEDNKPARTPIEAALISGHQQMAEFLLSAGAAAPDLDVIDQFYIALLAANAPEARALVETTPELTEQVLKRFPALLEEAVNKRSADALSLMLSFGFDPNGGENRSALHQAAFTGSIELLKILITAGGDTTRRDSYYFSPPMGWAIHNRQSDTVAFLETCAVDIFTASVRGLIPAIDELISTDPACLSLRFADLRPAPERYCGADWMTPLAFAIQGQHPATVRYLLELGADRSVTDPDGRSLLDYAQQFATDPDPESDGMKIVHLLSD